MSPSDRSFRGFGPLHGYEYFVALAGLLGVLALAGCGTPAESISIDGSSTVFPISDAVAETFLREEALGARVTVGKSGTGGGMKKFTAGEIDICDASREIADSEVEALTAAGVGFLEFPVALDGIAVVVHPDNDWVERLTVEQLAQVWRPKDPANKWSDLDPDWPDEKISLYGPGTDSGTFEYFTKVIVGKKKSSRADFTASEDDNVLVTGVSKDKYSLGYFGFAYYTENADVLRAVPVGPSAEACVAPTIERIRTNEYAPLSRPLFIYVRESLLGSPEGVRFVRFYLDRTGDLSQRVGYVALADDDAVANRSRLEEALTTLTAQTASGESEPPAEPAPPVDSSGRGLTVASLPDENA